MKLILILFSLMVSNLAFANPDIAKAIEKSVRDNARFLQEENTEAAMSTIHSLSASYLPTQNVLPQLFDNYDLSYEIESITFIGYDGELAYARIKQLTRKISGAVFQDNKLDMLQVFKLEAGVWKVWSQANMSIEYLN